MGKPKLLLLYGFAGAGKSTIANLYRDEHARALVIESDELIVKIKDWQSHEEQARHKVFETIKNMARTHLLAGNDVVIPYLLTNHPEAEQLELLATQCGAVYYEIMLWNDKKTAINRLLQRGTWGEAGQPPITKNEIPVIEALYSTMEKAIFSRPHTHSLEVKNSSPSETYQQLLQCIATR